MPPRSVTNWLEIATAQKVRPIWANEIKAHLESSQFYKKSKDRSYDKPSLVQP